MAHGITLIDVVVGTAIMSLIFIAVFGAFRISIELVYSTKAKTGAVSLMGERLEYIRSLPYGSVGTVGGIPAGNIPQLEQTVLNGIPYTIRTLVQYTDAPEDGLDAADENLITADYKTVKVEVLWSVRNSSRSTYAVTRVAPAGVETLEGGGTLKVSVFNADINPVPDASVHIVNGNIVPAVDVTTESNENGIVSFPGAPEAGGYEITVTKNGYSTAGTYSATAENPNPSPAHVAVLDEQTTSTSFFIDLLGSLRFYTFEPPGPGNFSDSFNDQLQLSATTSVTASGGALVLEEISPGVYAGSGSARSVSVTPDFLSAWNELSFSPTTPAGTDLSVRVYYYDGLSYTLVPDADLPGNSAGFATGPVDISGLSTAVYETLRLDVSLTTADTAVTPALSDWSLSYTAGPTPLPNVSFSIHGSKTIGTNGGNPVYKYEDTFTTGANAQHFIDAVEWDSYTVTLTDSYDISERCPNDISVAPGANLEPYYYLAPNTVHSLRVYVASDSAPVNGATVSVSGGAGNTQSSSCGQAYFGNLAETDYTVTVSKSGFQTEQELVSVSGDSVLLVGLTAQ